MKEMLFVPGLPRCGTTSLVNLLDQHPSISMGKQKEPHYFLPDYSKENLYSYESSGAKVPFSKLGFSLENEEYINNFSSGKKYNIDASTLYSVHTDSVDLIKKYNFKNVKFILMYRGSKSRAWSHFKFSVSRGEEYRGFERAISEELNGNDTNWLLGGYIKSGSIREIAKKIQMNFGYENLYIVNLNKTDITDSYFLNDIEKFLGLHNHTFKKDVYSNGSESLKYRPLRDTRILLRKIRQINPFLFDNRLTRFLFNTFMTMVPKSQVDQMPELSVEVNSIFQKIDKDNNDVFESWSDTYCR